MTIAGKSACNLDHWLLIVLLFRLLGGTTSGVLPVSVEEVSVSALQTLQHGQDFSAEGSDIAADSGGHWHGWLQIVPQHWSLGTLGPVMVGGEMCGGLRLLAHNLGLGTAPVAPWHQHWHHCSWSWQQEPCLGPASAVTSAVPFHCSGGPAGSSQAVWWRVSVQCPLLCHHSSQQSATSPGLARV